MATPVYESTTVTDFGVDATSHNANMPATVNAGDLLLFHAGFDGTPTITPPGGLTELLLIARASVVSGVWAKLADGTEGGTTVNFVTSAAERGSVHILRVSAWGGDLADLRGMGSVVPSSTGISATVGTVVRDFLWVLTQSKSSITAWGATPANYINAATSGVGENVASSCSIASATRALSAIREEIPTNNLWGVSAGTFWIVVPPA